MTSYFNTTIKAGSKPSETLDMFGIREGIKNTMSYAKLKLF